MRSSPRTKPSGRRAAPKSGVARIRRSAETGAPTRRTAARPLVAAAAATTAKPATRQSRSARPKRMQRSIAAFAAAVVMGLTGTLALAPTGPALVPGAFAAEQHDAVQSVHVSGTEGAQTSPGESYVASTGSQTLVRGGTNLDWAKLVLVDGGWQLTDANVTFMMRWMRQENGPDNWWNRNNPLNNGYGSGGGSGLGSYDTLVTAAEYLAGNLRSGRYGDVVAALDRGDDADATAHAVWASPWAGSHYGYGSQWSTRPYQVVEAPASAWGR